MLCFVCNVVYVPGIPLGKIILNKFSGSSSIFGIFGYLARQLRNADVVIQQLLPT
jgi:hypothetical protein